MISAERFDVLSPINKELLAVGHQYEATARKNLVNTLARNSEAQLLCADASSAIRTCAIFSETQGTVSSIFSGSKSSSFRINEKFWQRK